MTEPLITKYRPQTFAQIIGHDDVVDALERAVNSDSHPHSFLIFGPHGTGKTSLARIIATHFAAERIDSIAAVTSGVDDMRQLVENSHYVSMSGSGRKLFLIDEAHRLSRSGWDALLGITEEPPPHLYIALCTTEPNKVPETIKSRCYPVHLKPLKRDDMDQLLSTIADLQGWQVHDEVMGAVISASGGSPRMGLTLLQSLHDAKSADEVSRVVMLEQADNAIVKLLQLVLAGNHAWPRVQELLAQLTEDDDFERALAIGSRYAAAAMAHAKRKEDAQRAWYILNTLAAPTGSFDSKATLFSAIGQLIFGGH